MDLAVHFSGKYAPLDKYSEVLTDEGLWYNAKTFCALVDKPHKNLAKNFWKYKIKPAIKFQNERIRDGILYLSAVIVPTHRLKKSGFFSLSDVQKSLEFCGKLVLLSFSYNHIQDDEFRFFPTYYSKIFPT